MKKLKSWSYTDSTEKNQICNLLIDIAVFSISISKWGFFLVIAASLLIHGAIGQGGDFGRSGFGGGFGGYGGSGGGRGSRSGGEQLRAQLKLSLHQFFEELLWVLLIVFRCCEILCNITLRRLGIPLSYTIETSNGSFFDY